MNLAQSIQTVGLLDSRLNRTVDGMSCFGRMREAPRKGKWVCKQQRSSGLVNECA
jgi:hypothetical protein